MKTALLLAALLLPITASGQAVTGAITGRAVDSSGGLLPGVEVAISSPAMIGGARSATTNEQGVYRFTQVPAGEYRVSFRLLGFRTLNVDGVSVGVGATMTINGTMEIDSLSEEVTVISETPVIDLQSTTVGVNWDEKQMEELPYGRGIRGLARLVPGVSPNQFDVGGNTVGGSTTTGARSYGRAGDELIKFEGVVWDQFFGDYNTYDQIQVSAAAKGAEAQSPGLTLSFVIKSGGNDFSGNYLMAWQDGAFQGNNVTQELLDRGFDPGNNKFTRYNDISLDLGGPILRDKLWFYAAYGYNYSGLFIPGFVSEGNGDQVEFFTRLDNPTVKLTYQASQNNKFEFAQQLNRKWQPYRTASPFNPLESTQNQIAWTAIGPSAKWTRIINQRMTFDAGVNRSGYWWPDKAWTDDVRRTDLTTTQTRGAFLEQNREPRRWGYNGTWSWFTNIRNMSHEIKSGFLGYASKNAVDFTGHPNQQVYRYRSLQGETDFFLHPDSVQVFDYPVFVSSGVNYNSWFANDMVALTRKLTLNVGVRFDRYSSWLPEQGSTGGPFADPVTFPESHNFPVYNAWSPRVSVVYDLTGSGRMALKASYGKYAASGSGINAASGVVANAINPAGARTFTYSNWDGSIPYTPVPANLVSVTGGRNNTIDPNLKPAYLNEYTAGIDLGLTRDLTARINLVRKHDRQGNKEINLAQPFEAWTDYRTAVDPGRDNIIGTADDGIVEMWSVPRSYPTFGVVQTQWVNTGPDEGNDSYTAFEATFSKRQSNRWSMLASYVGDRRVVRNMIPRNPNEARYNWEIVNSVPHGPGFPETFHAIRLNGTYDLPWGMFLASTYSAQSGEYMNRIVRGRNANNEAVDVTVEAQAGRYDWVRLMDLRFSKRFALGKHTFEGMFDLFNALNTSVVLRQVTANGPDFGKPLSSGGIDAAAATAIPAARIFRLSARWKF
jgi:hypothetical protein